MVNYTQYPSLLFLSYTKDNAPDELPFEVSDNSVLEFLSKSEGYQQMWGLVAAFNSFDGKPMNFYLNNSKFKKVEFDEDFRNGHFRNFLLNLPANPVYGSVIFKNGGQYVYFYLPPALGKLKGMDGEGYMAVALFRENTFIGFEECVMNGSGLSVLPTGHYSNGMDIGGYISFVTISLSFFGSNTKPLPPGLNKTTEEIWTKD